MTALGSNASSSPFFRPARGGSSAEYITEAAGLLRRSIRMFFTRAGKSAAQITEAILVTWCLVQFHRHRLYFLFLRGHFRWGNSSGPFVFFHPVRLISVENEPWRLRNSSDSSSVFRQRSFFSAFWVTAAGRKHLAGAARVTLGPISSPTLVFSAPGVEPGGAETEATLPK